MPNKKKPFGYGNQWFAPMERVVVYRTTNNQHFQKPPVGESGVVSGRTFMFYGVDYCVVEFSQVRIAVPTSCLKRA